MGNGYDEIQAMIQETFDAARSKGGVEYIYALVRVSGLTQEPDPFIHLETLLRQGESIPDTEGLRSLYGSVVRFPDPFVLLVNLARCATGHPYEMSPFSHIYRGTLFDRVAPPPQELINATVSMVRQHSESLAQAIENTFPPDELGLVAVAGSDESEVKRAWIKVKEFLSCLLTAYRQERLRFRNDQMLYKLPGFEVLELVVNDEVGLYGFRMHFSNGSSAHFLRHPSGTEAINVIPECPINFWVGELDKLRKEWMMGNNKRLYEIGLPGRYNELGEWAPLIYPANIDPLDEEVKSLTDDPDVQGALLYMMCTGHRAIEFVVKTNLDIPGADVWFGDRLHLWKCPDPDPLIGANTKIYDGTWYLDDVTVDHIRDTIAYIGLAINRMAFAFGVSAVWRLKYTKLEDGFQGYATPDADDMRILERVLSEFPEGAEAETLNAAIDWYTRGKSSNNVFTKFLCYYVAIESMATAIIEGQASFGLTYSPGTKVERRQRRVQCIHELYDELYSSDPVRFVERAYFDCVQGLKQRTKQVCELVFGAGHEYIQALFGPTSEGLSLTEIRGKVAHGGVSLLSKEDRDLVRRRIGDMEEITRAFLKRLVFGLTPEQDPPVWSGMHEMHLRGDDPRSFLFVSHQHILPTKDWRIKSEWCD